MTHERSLDSTEQPASSAEGLANSTERLANSAGQPANSTGQPANTADSAGVPWQGRDLKPNPFSGDTGLADPQLVQALQAVAAQPLQPELHQAVFAALAGVRVYSPILPVAVEHGVGAGGMVTDNSSEMAMVRLHADDGRQCCPGFTGIPELTAWHPDARPVPIEIERLSVAAIAEDVQLLVLDPGTEHTFLIRRTALWAFVQGEDWLPAWANPDVSHALSRISAGFGWIASAEVRPGHVQVNALGPEIGIVLIVRPGREAEASQGLAAFNAALAADDEFLSKVDSLSVAMRKSE